MVKKSKSAGGIVLNPNGDVLVVNQKGRSWSLPKGHLEKGETALEAARREIYEESGIDQLTLIKELGTYERYKIGLGVVEDKKEIKQITLFLFKTSQTRLKPIDVDNPEARWVPKEKVAEFLTHDKDKEFFLKAKL